MLQFLKTCNDFFEKTTGTELARREEDLRSQQERAQRRFEDVTTELDKKRQAEAELQDNIADLQLQLQITDSKARGKHHVLLLAQRFLARHNVGGAWGVFALMMLMV